MKPGYKTTEFWLTLAKGLVGPVLAILVAAGVFMPGIDEEAVSGHVEQIVVGVVAVVGLVVSGGAVAVYTVARTDAKSVTVTTTVGDLQEREERGL